MIRLITRYSTDISYLRDDPALELDGPRGGPAQWYPVGRRADPADVLRASTGRRVVGHELIVAAPRAMSCLVAVGSDSEQAALVGAHRDAVSDALNYLARRAMVGRRSVLGDMEEVPLREVAVASFTHGVNRAGEPHVHDHVLVAPHGARARPALDSRALWIHVVAADAIYRAALRCGIGERTSRVAWRAFSGVEYVSGLDEGVRAIWPGRANDRGDKVHWRREDIVERWRNDVADHVELPTVPEVARDPARIFEHAFHAALDGRTLIARHHLVAAWADAAPRGTRGADVERAIDQWYPELVHERGTPQLAVTVRRARSLGDRSREPRLLVPERDPYVRSRNPSREGDGRSRER